MKRFLTYIVSGAALLALSLSCGKLPDSGEPSALEDGISGEWNLVSVTGLDMSEIDVYLVLEEETFELYQKVGTGRHYLYTGIYHLDGDELTGEYSDGTSWGSSYLTQISPDGNTLVLEADNVSHETSTYTRKAVPDEIRTEALPGVRSGEFPSAMPGNVPKPLL